MTKLKQILSGMLLFFVVSGGAFAFDQKNDQKVPDKEKKVTVPVAPKNPNSGKNSNKGRP
jgi:polysaccharide deacetylase 2 family uncharacterized protein YibQ